MAAKPPSRAGSCMACSGETMIQQPAHDRACPDRTSGRSPRDLFARRLREKSRTCHATGRCRGVDLIDQPLVQRNIDAHRSSGIRQQRHDEQHGTRRKRFRHLGLAARLVDRSCRRHRASGAFERLGMLAQGRRGIRGRLRQGVAGREAAFDIRKPDAESAVGILFDDGHIVCRHAAAVFQGRDTR